MTSSLVKLSTDLHGVRIMKICIVSSCGGHLTEVRALRRAYSEYEHFYVLNDSADLPPDMEDRTYFITHSERDWKTVLNLWEAFEIMRPEAPDVILSTGAGPVVPVSVVGKLFFSTEVIFVETIARIQEPSLTAKIMYYISDHFFYQWKSLGDWFPKGRFEGQVL